MAPAEALVALLAKEVRLLGKGVPVLEQEASVRVKEVTLIWKRRKECMEEVLFLP